MAATHALIEGDQGACGNRDGEKTLSPSKVTCQNCHAAIRADAAVGISRLLTIAS